MSTNPAHAELDRLVEELLVGSLDQAQRDRLAAILAADPAAAAETSADLALAQLLRLLHAPPDGQSLARVIEHLVHRNRPSRRAALAKAVLARSRHVRQRPRRSHLHFPQFAAAALLLLVIGLVGALAYRADVVSPTTSHEQATSQELATPPETAASPVLAKVTTGKAQLLDTAGGVIAPGAPVRGGVRYRVDEPLNVLLADGTSLRFARGTFVLTADDQGLQITLDAGDVTAVVQPQKPGQTLRFVTPHATAEVVGTRLRLRVSSAGTELDVESGRVRLRGRHDDGAVEISGVGNAMIGADGKLTATSWNPPPLLPALPADCVPALVGVNTWLGIPGTAEERDFSELILPRLRELGVRHVRNPAFVSPDPVQAEAHRVRWQQLAALGIDALWVVDDPQPDAQLVQRFLDQGGGCVRGLQGPDEADLLRPQPDPATLRDRMFRLRAAVDAAKDVAKNKPKNAAAPDIAVAGMTFAEPSQLKKIGDCSAAVDLAAMKQMLAGHHPETSGWGDDGYGSITWVLRQAAYQAPARPVLFARAGYHSALTQQDGHPGTLEDVIAVYLPRLILAYAEAGVARGFIAELADRPDGGIAGSWGLLRHDGTPKPAFAAVRGLLKLFADPGPDFPAQGLAVSIAGPEPLRQLLFQRRDGTHLLAFWLAVPRYDPDTQTVAIPPAAQLSVHVSGNVRRMRVQSFGDDGEPRLESIPVVTTRSGAEAPVTVRDRLGVIIIEH